MAELFEIDALTVTMDESEKRAARLGYALGYVHADNGAGADLPDDAQEWREVENLETRGA
jgi:hypothetical protein